MKNQFFIFDLNNINSVLLTFSEILFALSQFVKFLRSELMALFNFLIELLICKRVVSSAK